MSDTEFQLRYLWRITGHVTVHRLSGSDKYRDCKVIVAADDFQAAARMAEAALRHSWRMSVHKIRVEVLSISPFMANDGEHLWSLIPERSTHDLPDHS